MTSTGQRSFGIYYLLGFVLIAAVAGSVWYFWQARQQREAQETKLRAAAAAAGPSVQVAVAARGATLRRLALVGEALPYKSTTLYSKVSGYLTRIAVDVQTKPSQKNPKGGRIEKEASIAIANALPVCQNKNCKKSDKGVRSRKKILENGDKPRVCAYCGSEIIAAE